MSFPNQRSTYTDSQLISRLADNTDRIVDNSSICTSSGMVSLGSDAINYIQSQIDNGKTTVTMGAMYDDRYINERRQSMGTSTSELTLTYTAPQQDTTPPIITLTGANPQTIELGNGYTELGATTDDNSAVTIDDSNFVDSLGSYSVTYNSVDSSGNQATQITRTVNVVDTIPPSITAPNDITVEATGQSTRVNLVLATATDHSNFTITNNAPDSFPLGVTTITWTATDDSDNYSTATSTVTIQYTPPPNITLNGVNPQIIELNKNYTELGAVCSDNIDGTISPDIDSSTVDTTYAQSYQVRYDCADNSGNDAIQVTRTVIVQETVTPDITPPSITAPLGNQLSWVLCWYNKDS